MSSKTALPSPCSSHGPAMALAPLWRVRQSLELGNPPRAADILRRGLKIFPTHIHIQYIRRPRGEQRLAPEEAALAHSMAPAFQSYARTHTSFGPIALAMRLRFPVSPCHGVSRFEGFAPGLRFGACSGLSFGPVHMA